MRAKDGRRRPDVQHRRNSQIRALREVGLTFAEIGEMFGVTRQRAHQIAKGIQPKAK